MTIEDGVPTIENNDKVTIKDDFNIDDFNKKTYRPVDDRTIQEIIDDQFILIDDRTQQELADNDYLSFENENESDDNRVTIEDGILTIENNDKVTIKDDFNFDNFN